MKDKPQEQIALPRLLDSLRPQDITGINDRANKMTSIWVREKSRSPEDEIRGNLQMKIEFIQAALERADIDSTPENIQQILTECGVPAECITFLYPETIEATKEIFQAEVSEARSEVPQNLAEANPTNPEGYLSAINGILEKMQTATDNMQILQSNIPRRNGDSADPNNIRFRDLNHHTWKVNQIITTLNRGFSKDFEASFEEVIELEQQQQELLIELQKAQPTSQVKY
jgi:hypothetical protein